jgi:hypothetical protein
LGEGRERGGRSGGRINQYSRLEEEEEEEEEEEGGCT